MRKQSLAEFSMLVKVDPGYPTWVNPFHKLGKHLISHLIFHASSRVYGDKAVDVIHGLKNCPYVVVPIVIQRMNQKEDEWSESLRKFQHHWAEQDSKNYLRSLDHQGNHFRNRDSHFIRPKAAICAIEALARAERVSFLNLILYNWLYL